MLKMYEAATDRRDEARLLERFGLVTTYVGDLARAHRAQVARLLSGVRESAERRS